MGLDARDNQTQESVIKSGIAKNAMISTLLPTTSKPSMRSKQADEGATRFLGNRLDGLISACLLLLLAGALAGCQSPHLQTSFVCLDASMTRDFFVETVREHYRDRKDGRLTEPQFLPGQVLMSFKYSVQREFMRNTVDGVKQRVADAEFISLRIHPHRSRPDAELVQVYKVNVFVAMSGPDIQFNEIAQPIAMKLETKLLNARNNPLPQESK